MPAWCNFYNISKQTRRNPNGRGELEEYISSVYPSHIYLTRSKYSLELNSRTAQPRAFLLAHLPPPHACPDEREKPKMMRGNNNIPKAFEYFNDRINCLWGLAHHVSANIGHWLRSVWSADLLVTWLESWIVYFNGPMISPEMMIIKPLEGQREGGAEIKLVPSSLLPQPILIVDCRQIVASSGQLCIWHVELLPTRVFHSLTTLNIWIWYPRYWRILLFNIYLSLSSESFSNEMGSPFVLNLSPVFTIKRVLLSSKSFKIIIGTTRDTELKYFRDRC